MPSCDSPDCLTESALPPTLQSSSNHSIDPTLEQALKQSIDQFIKQAIEPVPQPIPTPSIASPDQVEAIDALPISSATLSAPAAASVQAASVQTALVQTALVQPTVLPTALVQPTVLPATVLPTTVLPMQIAKSNPGSHQNMPQSQKVRQKLPQKPRQMTASNRNFSQNRSHRSTHTQATTGLSGDRPKTASAIGLWLLLLFSTCFGMHYVVQVVIQPPAVHPTAVPWLRSQLACERTGRTWQDQTCWDRQHSAEF